MVKKESLSEKEIVDITKEENEETIEYIGLKEDEEIDGEVIKVLISSSYENKASNTVDDKNLIRKSTVGMLNKLIGMNQNIDIHMNTIVDNAIREAYFRALLREKNTPL